MELFAKARSIRLRTVRDKYLVAENDKETVSQHRDGSTKNSEWLVEKHSGEEFLRFKSCHGTYLTATNYIFVPGVIGKKVMQYSEEKLSDMSMTDWEPVRDGFQVRLRTRSGSFLRPNGGVPPWRNTVTHDMPHTSKAQEKVLWNIDIVEAIPLSHRRGRSDLTLIKSASTSPALRSSNMPAKRVTTLEDLW